MKQSEVALEPQCLSIHKSIYLSKAQHILLCSLNTACGFLLLGIKRICILKYLIYKMTYLLEYIINIINKIYKSYHE